MNRRILIAALLFFAGTLAAIDRAQELIAHVGHCIEAAEKKSSKISSFAIQIEGMTGYKNKHFLNNLCSLKDATYLEIGCWKGSTLIAALYGNESTVKYALGIDNFSEYNWFAFGTPRADFYRNIQRFLPDGLAHFIEQDCFTLDKKAAIPYPVNIYFYDGDHTFSSQAQAFTYFDDVFEEVFIAIVDDWNFPDVKNGTRSAFSKLGYQVLNEWELGLNGINGDVESWWNGLYIAVIKKN